MISEVENDPINKPKFIEKEDRVETRILVNVPENKWSEWLWPCMAWLIFLINFAAALSFIVDLFTVSPLDSDYVKYGVKHIVTIGLMCISYWSVVNIHSQVIRNNYDGRVE